MVVQTIDQIDLRALRRRHREVHGQTYVAEAFGTRRVKIGFSTNAIKRLQSVAIVCPVPLRLLALIDGPPALERDLHARFKAAHCHGEWFDLDRDSKLIAYIRQNMLAAPEFITCSRSPGELPTALHQLSPF